MELLWVKAEFVDFNPYMLDSKPWKMAVLSFGRAYLKDFRITSEL